MHKQANRQTNENSGTDSSVVVTRGKGGVLLVNGKGGQISGEGRRFKLGGGIWGWPTVQYAGDIELYT